MTALTSAPGCVISLQTFGGYGANFNPHAHALVSDGVLTPDGESLPLPAPDPAAVMEVFRRLFLERLHRAERLSESFMRNLLSWVHPGFSVFAGPPVDAAAVMQVFRRLFLERLHRAERLSESFLHNLLSWVHPGFSVIAPLAGLMAPP